MDVEAVPPARLELSRGERDAEACCAGAAHVVEQAAPTASEVENPPSRRDPDLLRDEVVLSSLRLLEGEREVAVVLGAAEVVDLAQREPDHPVGQRVAEFDVLLLR